jgi:hypothetical protein
MTTLAPDLELLRVELGRAFERDVARSVVRRRRRVFLAVAVATLVSAASSAAVASERVAGALDRAAASVMAVFGLDDDPAAERAAAPEVAELESLGERNPASSLPASLQVDRSRTVLAETVAPGVDVRMIAVPSGQGEVCYLVRIEYAAAGTNGDRGGRYCVEQLTAERPVELTSTTSPRMRDTLYGITADEVAAVRVRTSGGVEPAVLGTNAFFWIAPDQSTRATGLELDLRDGTTMSLPTPDLPGAPT